MFLGNNKLPRRFRLPRTKSFGQAFSKACRVKGQHPLSRTAVREISFDFQGVPLFGSFSLRQRRKRTDFISGNRTVLMLPPQFLPDLTSVRNRIISAGGKGVAAHDAPDRQKRTDDNSPLHHGIYRITRTGRRKAAGTRRFQGRKETTVQPHRNQPDVPQKNHGARKDTPDAFRKGTVTHRIHVRPLPLSSERQVCRWYWVRELRRVSAACPP